jgi:hypothetical protein
VPTRRHPVWDDMVQAVITRPTLRATTAWYVRRLCSRVSDYMAHGAMTPAEPHVQQARCDPTQGDESATLVDRHPHGTCGVRHGGLCPPAGLALCQSDGDRPQRAGLQSAWRTSLRHGPASGLREAGLVCGFRVSLCSLKVVLRFAAYTGYPEQRSLTMSH